MLLDFILFTVESITISLEIPPLMIVTVYCLLRVHSFLSFTNMFSKSFLEIIPS